MSLGSASNFFLGATSAGGGAEGPIKSVRFNSMMIQCILSIASATVICSEIQKYTGLGVLLG